MSERAWNTFDPGKTKLKPRYGCPPGNVYVTWSMWHGRYEVVYPARGPGVGFRAARDLMGKARPHGRA